MSSQNSRANDVVMRALALRGTPWRHQGRLPGVGVDCIGVVAVVAHGRGYTDYDRTDYGRDPVAGEIEAVLDRLFVKVDRDPLPSDVILFEDPKTHRQHLAIRTYYGMVHARAGRRVCEHRFASAWRRLVKGVYAWAS